MGIGMNAGGNIMGGYQQNPQYRQQQPTQPQQQAQPQQTPAPQAGGAAAGSWTCSCGAVNTGKFCSECGSKKPEAPKSVSAQTADTSFLQMQSSVPSAVQRQNNLNFKYKQSSSQTEGMFQNLIIRGVMATVNYTCPNCAAPLKFNPDKQMFSCEYCMSDFTEKYVQDFFAKKEQKENSAEKQEKKEQEKAKENAAKQAQSNDSAQAENKTEEEAVIYNCLLRSAGCYNSVNCGNNLLLLSESCCSRWQTFG